MHALIFFFLILPLALYFWRQTLSIFIVSLAFGLVAFVWWGVWLANHPCQDDINLKECVCIQHDDVTYECTKYVPRH